MMVPENGPIPVLVTGAAGRIGRALRRVWGLRLAENMPILWQSRDVSAIDDLIWDIGHNPPPLLPMSGIVLHLAGKTSGTAQDLAQNVTVTQAVCAAARVARAEHVFVMSTAAVYTPDPMPLSESAEPGPVNPYGASKLAAEQVAAQILQGSGTGLTVLRLGNLAGADALLSHATPGQPVILDPVAGQAGGPERSYIGPRVLARLLAGLIVRAAHGGALPAVLNVAQQPPVSMAGLLQARGQDWCFGAPRAGVVARVVLNTDRLAALIDLPPTDPVALIADLDCLPGWPR